MPDLMWIDNFYQACCFETEREAFELFASENVQ